jgi:hypothetical protein
LKAQQETTDAAAFMEASEPEKIVEDLPQKVSEIDMLRMFLAESKLETAKTKREMASVLEERAVYDFRETNRRMAEAYKFDPSKGEGVKADGEIVRNPR